MASAAEALIEQQPESTDLMVMATVNPLAVFMDEAKYSDFYQKLKEETDKQKGKLSPSTERGRAAIRSLAFKVTKAKTTLDKAGLGLTEEWRQKTNAVNAARKKMVTELDELAAEVRRPLTEWEEAEKARVTRCRQIIDDIKAAAVITIDDTSDTVRARGKDVWEIEIGEEFGDLADEAEAVKETAVATLGRALNRLIKEEEDQAELEQLRAKEAEREEREAEEREAKEAADKAEAQRVSYVESIFQHIRDVGMGMIGGQVYPYIILIRELEEKIPPEITDEMFRERAQDARDLVAATLEKVKDAQERQEQRARDEAAAEARREADREHAEEVARIKREAEEAQRKRDEEEATRKAEAERVAAEAARQAEEDRKREANRAHRARVQAAAKVAIMACGVDEPTAVAIVKAIVAGKVPAVTLSF